ncbi:hypothetical protein RBU49_03060 [Clostridium sp. MB40-C1]|uniref:hypothetical protein n=1 Tax=Clostridium sp. MB40-C1 TaxID=3070996 RepID=UPI0027E103AB|nr:hypothetical protein [Clostridium sp. MB40-C1]WMJ81250.1 hypothetical protein RBU49_03060 [Clostridium sp. MB40-C1]
MENNKIKISMFRPVLKLRFIDGIFNRISETLEGKEVEFYRIGQDVIDKVKNIKAENMSNEEFLYNMIPNISNIEMDIDLKEFSKMVKVPTSEFAQLINNVMDILVDVLRSGQEIINLEQKMKAITEKHGIKLPQEPTKDEKLQALYDELTECKDDKEKRKEILKQITSLEVEDNE